MRDKKQQPCRNQVSAPLSLLRRNVLLIYQHHPVQVAMRVVDLTALRPEGPDVQGAALEEVLRASCRLDDLLDRLVEPPVLWTLKANHP